MKRQRIIFVGSQNLGGLLDDGETMKNYMLSKALEAQGCKICKIDMRRRPKRIFYMIKYIINIVLYKKSKLVMSSSPMVADRLFKIAKLLRWKDENSYYWVIGGTFGKLIIDNKVQKGLYIDMKRIIVEGDIMMKQLVASGFDNVMVLPNLKEISYIPPKKHRNNSDIRFVFLSRVMPEKGVDYILEAAHILLSQRISNFTIDIYGRISQQYKEKIDAELTRLTNVKYKGFLKLNSKEGYDLLSTYDVMLFPTYWHGEGFPGIIIDAFIAGLPVIASDWNLNTSLIKSGVNGIVIPPHNPKALADSMCQVINGSYDLKQMSETAQNECLRYNLDNVINKELLKKIEML